MKKFRAWDTLNNCWINIFKIILAVGGEVQSIQDIDGEVYGLHQVILEQYINWKDAENRKVFENDLYEYLNKPISKRNPFIVKYEQQNACYLLESTKNENFQLSIHFLKNLKYAGNIHEQKGTN